MNFLGEYNNAAQGILAIVMPLVLMAAIVVPLIIRDGWKAYKRFLLSKGSIIWLVCTFVLIIMVISANL